MVVIEGKGRQKPEQDAPAIVPAVKAAKRP
jgi:hypothetical protein